MMTKQNNKQIQSILYVTLLFSTLILTTGCFGKPDGAVVNTGGHRMGNNGYPNPNQLNQPQNGSYISNSVFESFVGEPLVGAVIDMTVEFYDNGDIVTIVILDEHPLQDPFEATLNYSGHDQGFVSFSDDTGTVYFEITEDPSVSQIYFENIDGTSGILGDIDTCRVEGTC